MKGRSTRSSWSGLADRVLWCERELYSDVCWCRNTVVGYGVGYRKRHLARANHYSLGAFESGVARLARPARRTLLGLLPPPKFGMLREKWCEQGSLHLVRPYMAEYSPHAHPMALCEKWCRPPRRIASLNTAYLQETEYSPHNASMHSRSPLSESAAHAALLLAGAALLLAGVHGKRRLRAMHAASRARLT